MVDMDGDAAEGELNDHVLLQEIELLGKLIDAASHADRPLRQFEIDVALNVKPSLRART